VACEIRAPADRIVEAHGERTGIDAEVFSGTSMGALESGHLEYVPA
jgi:hypothetical protein